VHGLDVEKMKSAKLKITNPEEEIKAIDQNGTYQFAIDIDGARVTVNWLAKQQGLIGDLDITALVYDERVS
jgi:hypothetical protein